MGYKKIKGKLEHQLVVEAFIQRKLKKDEVVHHISGNPKDNSIENLFLFPSQKAHKSFENKVRQHGNTNNIKKQIQNRWSNENTIL